MLCDRREFSTAKQAQSAVYQYGREGMVSELYGVTNWDFDFRGHKLQGDWQAVLGVTVHVPYLNWISMAGEAKKDYPAAIGYMLRITSFGNRVNTFGVIHNCDEMERWFGPNAWRTTGEQWSYEYCIKKTGILKAPEIFVTVK